MTSYNVSPPKKPAPKPDLDQGIPKSFLVLGAFSGVPKIHFEELPLGKSRRRILVIRNPGDKACFLAVTKIPAADFRATVEDTLITKDEDLLVPPASETLVDILWTPKEQGQFFEVLQLQSSTGGPKLSVHLLGKCTPPPKGAALSIKKRRPASESNFPKAIPATGAKTQSASVISKNGSRFQSNGVTLPQSPNFSTRLNNKAKSSASAPSFATESQVLNKPISNIEKTTSALSKIVALPFSPAADPIAPAKTLQLQGRALEGELELMPPPCGETKNQTYVLSQATTPCNKLLMDLDKVNTDAPSPSRRETFLIPTPSSERGGILPSIDDADNRNSTFLVGKDEKENYPCYETASETSEPVENLFNFSGIELDAQLIAELREETLSAHDSMSAIFGKVDSQLQEGQKAALSAISKACLSNFNDDTLMSNITIDGDGDGRMNKKASSGEFLCMDSKDLSPTYPDEPVRDTSELASAIKQQLKDGKSEAEIIESFTKSENDVSDGEIRLLLREIGNKYKSFKECFEILRSCFMSEQYACNRIAIQKAIKNGQIRVREDVNMFDKKFKIPIITSLMDYQLPWLWSALCLIYHYDKLEADDIGIMCFIDEFLFGNNEFEAVAEDSPSEEMKSEFLQHMLEIVYLLDQASIPLVFSSPTSSKQMLEQFEKRCLKPGSLEELIKSSPLKLTESVDPVFFYMQKNLSGGDVQEWTNIVALIQELSGKDICLLQADGPTGAQQAVELVRMAITEAKAQGIEVEIPEEDFNWLIHGVVEFDKKFLRETVVRIRLNQLKQAKATGDD